MSKIALFIIHCSLFAMLAGAQDVPKKVLELPRSANNCRNSEGDFALLKDGRIIFIYSHYLKGTGHDNDKAILASRVSSDGGKTWSTNSVKVVDNEGGMNVMSVSLLRLKEGPLALFYIIKNSEEDCRPAMRISTDEGNTWSDRTICIPDSEKSYYVLNNCRVLQMKSGRLVLPVCEHAAKNGKTADWKGRLCCYLSDDGGKTWRRSKSGLFETFDVVGKRVTTQEPGVIELKDGRVLMFARTDHGRHWFYYSSDGCETWTAGEPGNLWGPCGPATLKRLKNGDILAIWNDHEYRPELAAEDHGWGKRVPLTVAISKDDGRSWPLRRDLETDPKGWYCYIAALELEGRVLLGYCAGDGLSLTRLTDMPLSWLYAAPPLPPVSKRVGGGTNCTFVCEGEQPAISPDGKKLAFVKQGKEQQHLGVLDLASGKTEWIEQGPGLAAYPTWLPQGDLVYTFGNDTETAFAAWKNNSSVGYHLRRWSNGIKTDLTSGRVRDYTPVATPDGRTVYFASTRWVQPKSKVYSTASTSMIGALDLATGETKLVIDSPNGFNSGVVNPAVSPDGRLLVWGQLDNFFGYWRIYGAKTVDLSKAKSAPFTPLGLIALSPRWHPDGTLICFTGFKQGTAAWCVWVEDVNSGAVKLLCEGENPCFSPDGKTLFYERSHQVWLRPFSASDRPKATASARPVLAPEKVLQRWDGSWKQLTHLPLDAKKFAFGDKQDFFVRVRVKTVKSDAARFFVQGEYAESKMAFQLYRTADVWFATRDAQNIFVGAKQGGGMPVGEHVLTGIRIGGRLCLSIDGARASEQFCDMPMALNQPQRLAVGRNLLAGEEVLSIEIGTGWPSNVPKGLTREDILK